MNLHEEVSRIKSMMGVLTEDEVTFPITVSDSYNTAKYGKGDCDTFHSFNDNGRKEIGGMNRKVNEVLMDVYNKGFNPDITAVDVEMNSDTMEVKWSVTINKSEDGNAWTGQDYIVEVVVQYHNLVDTLIVSVRLQDTQV